MEPGSDVALPRVSVIVPAFNEERHLAGTLRAIARQDYPRDLIEVIVVDNGSSDRTVEVARDAGAIVIVEPKATVAALRNAGRARASGDVLAFLDADCTPADDWLRQAAASLAEQSAVTGARVAVPEAGTWVERAWFFQSPQGRRQVPYINSGNLIVERRVFDAVGGFDPTLISGEDSDFCRRAAAVTAIVADDRIRAVHQGNPKTAGEFLRREVWHGMGALGRSALSVRNKPVLGAVALVALLVLLAAGAAMWAAGRGPVLAAGAALGLVALLVMSAVHRLRALGPPGRLVQLSALYFLYYLGRALALARLGLGLGHRHRAR